MWVAFVFFGDNSEIYFIEGSNKEHCKEILKIKYKREGELHLGKSGVYEYPTFNGLLNDLGIVDFNDPPLGVAYFLCSLGAEKKTPVADGMKCSHCSEYCFMAEANQPDGSFVCFCCRDKNRWRYG